MDINLLIEALNNPNSPQAQKLLDYLAMSPLDPAAAMQQVQQMQAPMPNIPGGPQAGLQPSATPGMAELLQTGSTPPMAPRQLDPGVNPGSRGPWSFDFAAPNNAAPMTDPNNPAFVPPAAAQAASMDPNAQLVPGETGGMPDAGMDAAGMLKMLEGLGGLGGEQEPRMPMAPASSPTNNWRGFQAAQIGMPGSARIPTLAELLGR